MPRAYTRKEYPTQQQVHEMLRYDKKTGIFKWRKDTNGRVAGSIAGYAESSKYIVVGMLGTKYHAHVLAWIYVHGSRPPGDVDHKDGDSLNNRIGNLRQATRGANTQNRKKAHKNNRSGLLGVHIGRWGGITASIMVSGERMYLGSFSSPQKAHEAYLAAKRKFHAGCLI